jgi:hypothetical protein
VVGMCVARYSSAGAKATFDGIEGEVKRLVSRQIGLPFVAPELDWLCNLRRVRKAKDVERYARKEVCRGGASSSLRLHSTRTCAS